MEDSDSDFVGGEDSVLGVPVNVGGMQPTHF